MKDTQRYDLLEKQHRSKSQAALWLTEFLLKIQIATIRATLVTLLGVFSSAGPLSAHADEVVLGNAKAPVTIIEYGSLACDHCAHFHFDVLPILKSRYIEKGQVRFIFRDFPTSNAAVKGAVATRCAGDRYYEMQGQLFSTLEHWLDADDINTALIAQATSIGLDKTAFSTCINNPQHEQAVLREQQKARAELGVTGTPTFIINGTRVKGFQSADEFDSLIKSAQQNKESPTADAKNVLVPKKNK
ncbi:MAG: DsbA family protein [Moraxellaceae bacterium]|nr:MAG: DsbA family protein [Moraxellaceae bacterium]